MPNFTAFLTKLGKGRKYKCSRLKKIILQEMLGLNFKEI